MRADKYAGLHSRKQSVVGIEVISHPAAAGTIPIVNTAEPDQLTTYWWDTTAAEWLARSRRHDPISRDGHDINSILHRNWCQRVGLAAASDNVFIVYKRSITPQGQPASLPELYVEVFPSPAARPGLGPSSGPQAIPLAALGYTRAGFHVWAGFHLVSKHLLVLAQLVKTLPPDDIGFRQWQMPREVDSPRRDYLYFDARNTRRGFTTQDVINYFSKQDATPAVLKPVPNVGFVEKPQLVLLRADLSQGLPDFTKASSWRAIVIDDGGWDLDAVLSGDVITCVYRRDPFWISITDAKRVKPSITTNQTLSIPSALGEDAPYPHLFVRAINAATGAQLNAGTHHDVPGGANPRIHSVSPLVLTMDRVARGELIAHPPQTVTHYGFEVELPLSISADLEQLRKVMLYFEPTRNSWMRFALLDYSAAVAPRSIAYGPNWGVAERITAVVESSACLASGSDFHAVWIVDQKQVAAPAGMTAKYALQVDLLHHRPEYHAVVVSRLLVEFVPVSTTPVVAGEMVVDIGHGQIGPTYTPAADPENGQFDPFASSLLQLDNTLGGCLNKDRSTLGPGLKFYAYTDLGDGGCRVIYDDQLPAPNPLPPGVEKGMDPASVVGPGGVDEWYSWDVPDWSDASLPIYDVSVPIALLFLAAFDPSLPATLGKTGDGSIEIGIQPKIDTLVGLYSLLGGTSGTVVIDGVAAESLNGALSPMIGNFDIAELLWMAYDKININDDEEDDGDVRFTLNHVRIELGKYRLEFFLKPDGSRDRVELSVRAQQETSYRAIGNVEGQGAIDLRFTIRFSCDDLEIDQWGGYPELLSVDGVDVELTYGRRFTPGVLVSETRSANPLTIGSAMTDPMGAYAIPQELVSKEVALATKPNGDSTLEVRSVDVATSVNFSPQAIGTAATIAFLLTVFLLAIALVIYGLVTGIGAAANIPPPYGPIIVIGLVILLTITILILVPILLRDEIERRIRRRLQKAKFKKSLDDSGLLTYAGEGLAEVLARKAIETINAGANPLSWGLDPPGSGAGRNRFKRQFWQTIFVTAGKVRFSVRR